LTLSDEQIGLMLEDYDQQSRAIKEEMIRFTWWMRGGISYTDAMSLSQEENKIIRDIIKENMETTNKSGMPFF
jgi:signal transduction histidine kinase